MEILNITQKPETDESIEEYAYHSYEPITGTNLNNPGEIRINIETQDLFTHPSESYLVFNGKLVKNANDAAYENADVISLTNNGLMHLFSNIKYQLSGQEIESVFHPGQATSMLGLLKYQEMIFKNQSDSTNCGIKIQAQQLIFKITQVLQLDKDKFILFKSLTRTEHFHSEFR